MERPSGVFVEAGPGGWGHLPSLARAGLVHGFSCRDMGPTGPPREVEKEVARDLASCLGVADLPRTPLQQRHTARVHLAPQSGWGDAGPPVGDALVAAGPGVVLELRTADCLPVLAVEPARGLFAAAHAGWRGTLDGVVPATLEALRSDLGADLAATWVAVGPAIRACCYEVGPEVEGAFRDRFAQAGDWMRTSASGRPHLDLVLAVRSQAIASGVPATRFLDSGWCTRCRNDRFFSYRRDGTEDRQVTVAWLPSD